MAYSVGGESSSRSDTLNSTPRWKYDVFLSFAGKDTRLKFLSHLNEAFKRSGIKTFKDDVDLERGGVIEQDLFQAIEDSLCAVLIISENYANSTWCLDELLKILESQNTLNRRVFPIFYDVNPADVRKQTNSFGKALAEHENKFGKNTTKVQNWKDALFEIGHLSGWDTRSKDEADLIKNIVGDIWTYCSSKLPLYHDNLVGIDSRVGDMMPLLEIGLNDKRFVGIWGMGGVGKTTLARVVSKKLSDKFEVCCFLDKVRETLLQRDGLVSLQKELLYDVELKDMKISNGSKGMEIIRNHLCNRKVLLVLDDVDRMNQLKNLAERADWFGEGSRIIITTRDRHLLTASGVEKIYEMKTMKKDESLKLFSNKAFFKGHPEKPYLKLSESVIEYAGGLPLALETLGSFLHGRSEAEWRDALDRMNKNPHNDILEVLKISYDGLVNCDQEKTIFLDIACFFKGWRKKEVTQVLKGCGLNPTIGINVLIEKSLLVETKDQRLDMHDLLKDLGRYIVHQQSPNVGQRSRLWEFEDIKYVLENNKGSEQIQAILMRGYHGNKGKIELHPEAFSNMSNIRLLFLDSSINGPLILPRGLRLKVLKWPLFPLEALPHPLDELVHIEMQSSNIKQLWNGIQSMNHLKFINLSNSSDFTETPDFSSVQSLEHLCLSSCKSLVKVDPSLGKLKRLVEVDLVGCQNLEILPSKLETNSLRKLDLSGCKKVARLPEFGEGMKELSYLDVSETAITTLPESLGFLTGLRELNVSATNLVNLPTGCFSSLSGLIFLSLEHCKRLMSLPRLPPRLSRLNASHCYSLKPLSNRQLWDLLASLNHEYRGQTKFVISDKEEEDIPFFNWKYRISLLLLELKDGKLECLPLRNFFAVMPRGKIPSWFDPNIKYFNGQFECKIEVGVPPNFRVSKWCGIVVCLNISEFKGLISWSSKAPEDDDYNIWNEWRRLAFPYGYSHHFCVMVLEFNEKTCWQHLRGENNRLHIKLSVGNQVMTKDSDDEQDMTIDSVECSMDSDDDQDMSMDSDDRQDMMDYYNERDMRYVPSTRITACGGKVICIEEIQKWRNDNDFNQLTQTQHAPPYEVTLPLRLLGRVIGQVK